MTADALPINVVIEGDDDPVRTDPETGTVETDTPDGGVVIQFNPKEPEKEHEDSEDKWFKNLVDEIDGQELSRLANDLIEQIEADNRSREGHLQGIARGMDLLGLKVEAPRSSVSDSSATSEGVSPVTNPLLLEAILKGWANSRAELLPSEGPVKVSVEWNENEQQDELAQALEDGMNHYLTVTASEYVPDTSSMLLWGTYFGGSGFKKVYRCPMRRRPVSESVPVKNFIVSDATKDLKSCARITLEIEMRPSLMKRMQLIAAYKRADLTQPVHVPNVVDEKIAGIQGTMTQKDRPEDEPYNLYETQCELDLPRYAPGKFKGEGIPLPYLVTIDKDSREILSLRRDFEEDDEECERTEMYLKYPYVPGPGFYGTGMLNILGNASAAMTAAWREALDAGMYASFPGGIVDNAALVNNPAAKQTTANFRVGPGEFAKLDLGGRPINQVLMPLPYKDVTPGLMALMDKITAQSEKLAGAAEVNAGEGLQNIPVGTMLAQIEQATKIMAAAHKDMHAAQAKEIELFIKLFRKHPEDFWRLSKIGQKNYWSEQKFLQALEDYDLVPRSDPNTPSHLHRVMKAVAYSQIITNPMLGPYFNTKEIAIRICRALRDDPAGLVVDPPPQQGMDPAGMAKLMDAQTKQQANQIKAADIQNKGQLEQQKLQGEKEVEGIRLAREEVIHRADMARADREHHGDMAAKAAELQMQREQHGQEMQMEHARHGLAVDAHMQEQRRADEGQQHEQQLAERQATLGEGQALHQAGMAEEGHQREMKQAEAKPKGGSKS